MKKTQVIILSVAAIGILFLSGCCQRRIRPGDLNKLRLGMSKQEVVESIGEPSIYRGSMVNKFNQVIDVFEYIVDMGPTADEWRRYWTLQFSALNQYAPLALSSNSTIYWLFFCDSFLTQWCQAGDWETTQHQIQEIRFR